MVRRACVRRSGLSLLIWTFIALGCGLLARPAFAQFSTGTILGVVKDSSGGVVAGAQVTVRNTGTALSRTFTTGSDGSYEFPDLPIGTYDVTATGAGFQPLTSTGLVLSVGQKAVLNLALQVGAQQQSVTVTAEAPMVNTTDAEQGELMTPEKMQNLPLNGRNYADLVLLQPGTSLNTNHGNAATIAGDSYSANGAPLTSNNHLLDGTPLWIYWGSGSNSIIGSTLGVDGIAEYRVISGFFGAEYGGKMGSQLLITSKSGTNGFHGDVFDYLRNSALDARYPFLPAGTKQHFARNQFGGSIGGPIKKDKLFFEVVNEDLKAAQPVPTELATLGPGCIADAGATVTNTECPQLGSVTSVVVNPVTAKVLPYFRPPTSLVSYVPNDPANDFTYTLHQPQNEYYEQARLDYNISAHDSMFVRDTNDDASMPSNTNPGQTSPFFYALLTSQANYVTLQETHLFSNVVNAARADFDLSKAQGTPVSNIGTNAEILPGQLPGTFTVPGVTFGWTTNQNTAYELVWGGADDVTYTRGRHSIKFGASFLHITTGADFFNPYGSFGFHSVADFLTGNPYTFSFAAEPAFPVRRFSNVDFALYAEDDIRVTPRFTLNLGVRYEPATMPREASDRETFLASPLTAASTTIGPLFAKNPSILNIGPRIGFAWDLFGTGKTALRAGFSELFDVNSWTQGIHDYSDSDPPFTASIVPTFTGQAAATYNLGLPVTGLATNASGTATTPLPSPGGVVKPSITMYNYNFKQAGMYQWTLAVDQQLPWNSALTVAYDGTRGVHLLREDGNIDLCPYQIVNGQFFFPAGPSGPTSSCAVGINPNFSSVSLKDSNGDSIYHALQVSWNKRISRGVQIQADYTWSKMLDNDQGSAGSGVEALTTQYSWLNPRLARGPAATDVPQILRVNLIYNVPNLITSKGLTSKLLNGWWTSSIVSAQSGLPFDPLVGFNTDRSGPNGSGIINNPDLVTAANLAAAKAIDPLAQIFDPATVIEGNPTQWFNPHMFTVPAYGSLGDAGRGLLRGPGIAEWDASLVKDTRVGFLGEAGAVEFRAEFFNVINHENFAAPGQGATGGGSNKIFSTTGVLSNVGRIVALVNPNAEREIQFALKLIF